MMKLAGRRSLPLALALAVAAGGAAARSLGEWEFGAVLDLTQTSRALALGGRDRGLQLGHSDLTASGPLGTQLKAHLGAVPGWWGAACLGLGVLATMVMGRRVTPLVLLYGAAAVATLAGALW